MPAPGVRSRDPTARSPAGCAAGRPPVGSSTTPSPRVYLHEYTSGGITVRGLVGALDMSRRATDLAERAVLPHEGIHPHRAHDLADHMLEMRLNPAPILLVHRGPEEVRSVVRAAARRPSPIVGSPTGRSNGTGCGRSGATGWRPSPVPWPTAAR